jgi:hypothetical protein
MKLTKWYHFLCCFVYHVKIDKFWSLSKGRFPLVFDCHFVRSQNYNTGTILNHFRNGMDSTAALRETSMVQMDHVLKGWHPFR